MRKRTQARELALQILYQLDLRGDEVLDSMEGFFKESTQDPEILAFARETVTGFRENRAAIDGKIESAAKNWELRRMAVIDRNILRMSTYELLFRDDIPALVSINEAIDLAKKYSTPQSGRFVNGILDHIRLTEAPEAKRSGPRGPKPEDGSQKSADSSPDPE